MCVLVLNTLIVNSFRFLINFFLNTQITNFIYIILFDIGIKILYKKSNFIDGNVRQKSLLVNFSRLYDRNEFTNKRRKFSVYYVCIHYCLKLNRNKQDIEITHELPIIKYLYKNKLVGSVEIHYT